MQIHSTRGKTEGTLSGGTWGGGEHGRVENGGGGTLSGGKYGKSFCLLRRMNQAPVGRDLIYSQWSTSLDSGHFLASFLHLLPSWAPGVPFLCTHTLVSLCLSFVFSNFDPVWSEWCQLKVNGEDVNWEWKRDKFSVMSFFGGGENFVSNLAWVHGSGWQWMVWE